MKVTIDLDDDDYRDFNRAIAVFQRKRRWERFPDCKERGVMLPEGDSDMAGAIVGEICRDWLEARNELPQGGAP